MLLIISVLIYVLVHAKFCHRFKLNPINEVWDMYFILMGLWGGYQFF